MNVWQKTALLSALAGGLLGGAVAGRRGVVLGGVVPWAGVLGWLIYNKWLAPSSGIDVSYSLALVLGGSFAAVVGAVAAAVAQYMRGKV